MKTKAIKDIKVGDYVQSYNHEEDKITSAKVVEVFKHDNVSGTKVIINKKFITTGNHPVYVDGKYKPASQARVGSSVIGPDGIEIKIHTIELKPMTIDVYNIEVEGDHNYFAGDILNHNKCGDYKGNDDAMDAKLDSIKASATNYQGAVGNIVDVYYQTVNTAVGAPDATTQAQEFTWNDSDVAPELDAEGLAIEGTGGQQTWTPGEAWQEDWGGGKTTWGLAVQDFTQAQDAYTGAVGDAANAMIAAEESLDITKEDVGINLETEGEDLADAAETAMSDIESQVALKGFAASGEETLMKKEVRAETGEGWDVVTSDAQSVLAGAIADYEKLMGSGETTEIEGEMIEDVGSIQSNLDAAAEALQTAGGKLQGQFMIINNTVLGAQSAVKTDLTGLESNFYDAVSSYYGSSPSPSPYIDSKEDISKQVKNAVGTYVTGTTQDSWDYNTGEYGYVPGGGGTLDASDTPTTQAGSGGGLLGVNLFYLGGECLEGNVRIVMGDKNASN